MAKIKTNAAVKMHISKPKVKRTGVHSKTKQSSNKASKHYVKQYAAQGR